LVKTIDTTIFNSKDFPISKNVNANVKERRLENFGNIILQFALAISYWYQWT